jgi:uncharacterized protein (DUF433 family)
VKAEFLVIENLADDYVLLLAVDRQRPFVVVLKVAVDSRDLGDLVVADLVPLVLLVVPLLVPPAPVESFIINKSQNEGRTMSESLDRITRDPAVMNGQPCIRGMRITVRRALEAMAMYPDRQELFREYPELDDEDLRQALAFAAASLDDKLVELAPR